jgi:DNA polymerase-3 subunit epsilon
MNWLNRIIPGRSDAGDTGHPQHAALAAWRALPDTDPGRPHFETRYVVVNTEASHLDLERTRLLSVAAIGVDGGRISAADSYYATLGDAPADALQGLLGIAGKAPLVVFNARFNRVLLERAFAAQFGLEPQSIWLDLYVLLPALFPELNDHPVRLADWMASFGIETFQRHHALGDAWAIAQLLLAVQARAQQQGAGNARALADIERTRRQLWQLA